MDDFRGKLAVVTGGTGVLLRPAVLELGRLGATVALLGRDPGRAGALAAELAAAGAPAHFIQTDVTESAQVRSAAAQVLERWGRVDILINGAGGNRPQATTSAELSFFDVPEAAIRHVYDLNFTSALGCCQAFGRAMAAQGHGCILNVTSMAAIRPLTRVVSYSAAKAALASLTQWLAVHMAQTYSPRIRVNAVAPGFFLTEQNRFLLTDADTGQPTARGQAVLAHTPANRFGDPADVTGPLLFLLSDAAGFITGVTLPVDGGFSAYSGV
jgi:NAD(P)-dependent dehydrogenase (short-subunit alcohol dehydrogenase family)